MVPLSGGWADDGLDLELGLDRVARVAARQRILVAVGMLVVVGTLQVLQKALVRTVRPLSFDRWMMVRVVVRPVVRRLADGCRLVCSSRERNSQRGRSHDEYRGGHYGREAAKHYDDPLSGNGRLFLLMGAGLQCSQASANHIRVL